VKTLLRLKSFALLSTIAFGLTGSAHAEPGVQRDIEFGKVDGRSLKLDLYLPASTVPKPPLIVYVHGGAWRAGSKSEMPLGKLVAQGFAVASVDYRLSTEAVFPAQIHDIKAAIRFLRARQNDYGYDASRIAVAGGSAGGHLAELVGVTNGVKALEGTVGDHPGQSSSVQAGISFYGASNLQSILAQSTPHGLSVRVPALQLLLGGQPEEKPELARLASPVAHIDANDPPLLLLHGDADPQMPVEQSYELERAYTAAGRPVKLVIIPGAKHGGKEFYDDARTAVVAEFLRENLKGSVGR
jgi:acetyl esterase/lipase